MEEVKHDVRHATLEEGSSAPPKAAFHLLAFARHRLSAGDATFLLAEPSRSPPRDRDPCLLAWTPANDPTIESGASRR